MTDTNQPGDEDESESPPDVIEETVDGQRDAIDAFKEELEAAEGTEPDDDCCEE